MPEGDKITITGIRGVGHHGVYEFERQAGNDELVQRSVIAIVLEQPVEPEQGREQRCDPQHRRSDAREQWHVRPDAKRNHRDNRQKEDQARESAATGSERKAGCAADQG